MQSSYTTVRVLQYFLSLTPGTKEFERNAWLKELWQHKFGCEFNLPESSTAERRVNLYFEPSIFINRIY